MTKIVTVAAAMGGVGKTTIAYELAYLLDAPLVDLDWDRGGATGSAWGYRVRDRVGAPILDAFEKGRTPRLLRGKRKPDLVPSHPDLEANQPPPGDVADALEKWAAEWARPFVVVDTHPGAGEVTFGAMSASEVIVVPTVLRTKELDGLGGMLEEFSGYPLLLIPNKVPRIPPARELTRVRRMRMEADVQVGPVIADHGSWLRSRKAKVALTSYPPPEPARIARIAADLRAVADAVRSFRDG